MKRRNVPGRHQMAKRPTRKIVTIQDVAHEADVSQTTVSLVLQDKGNLRPETRARVRKAIKKIGYHPRTKKTSSTDSATAHFALIVDDITNPYFHNLYKGIDDNLPADGVVLTMASSEDSVARQRELLCNLAGCGTSGLILVPATGTKPEDIEDLTVGDPALILAVRNIERGSFDYIGFNPMQGMMIATEHLTSLGHRDIAFIGGFQANFAYGERYAGFAASLVKHGVVPRPDRVIDGGSTRAFGREAVERVLQNGKPPDAIIGYNDFVALGIIDGLLAAGMTPGKDIAVVGYDNIPEAAEQPVPLTTVSAPTDRLAEIIAKTLLSMKRQDAGENAINVTCPCSLVVRESCGVSVQGATAAGSDAALPQNRSPAARRSR